MGNEENNEEVGVQALEEVQQTAICYKATLNAGKGIHNFVEKVKAQLEDGWQPDQDIPPILTAAITELATGLQGMPNIGPESAGDKVKFANSLYFGLGRIPFLWVK